MRPFLAFLCALCLTTSSALALDILQPERVFYGTNDIPLHLRENGAQQLNYSTDGTSWVEACSDCDEFKGSIILPTGNHTLYARSLRSGVLLSGSVPFEVRGLQLRDVALTIIAPREGVYNGTSVPISVAADGPVHAISIILDGETQTLCENCTKYIGALDDLGYGEHQLDVSAWLYNTSAQRSLVFATVDAQNPTFSIEVDAPTTQEQGLVDIAIKASAQLESITLRVDNARTALCEYCDAYAGVISLKPGEHTLAVSGKRGVEVHVDSIKVVIAQPDLPPVEFSGSLERLPDAFAAGEIDDAQLAAIIRQNQLPSNVVDRLIETGALGTQAIDAILDTQVRTVGFLRGIFNAIGLFRIPSYAERIYWEYDLPTVTMVEIASRADVGKKVADEIRARIDAIPRITIE